MIEEKEYNEAKNLVNRYEQSLKQDKKNCYKFNINDSVLIKLNDKGFEHWIDSWKDVPKQYQPTLEYLKERMDKDGYIQFQLWSFMEIFGETISMGGNQLFENNIRFYKKEMKDINNQ